MSGEALFFKDSSAVLTKQEMRHSLRLLAQKLDFNFGSAVDVNALDQDQLYREHLAREFNMVTAENEMKFTRVHPESNRFDFAAADRLVNFATEHRMAIRGHTLVWHTALPDWLRDGTWTREELVSILESHIKTVVGRYRGKIAAWDVVNEAIADDSTLRNTFWLRGIGSDYIEMAFRWAHEADPDALLIYNDYGGEGLNSKSDAIYQLVQSLLEKGVPIHGVGFQMHVAVDSHPNPQDLANNMKRLSELGLQVEITEMDVRIKQPSNERDFDSQAQIYRDALRTCLLAENCNTLVTWGFSDRYSWVPRFFPGWGEALLFDQMFRPRTAYFELLEELADH